MTTTAPRGLMRRLAALNLRVGVQAGIRVGTHRVVLVLLRGGAASLLRLGLLRGSLHLVRGRLFFGATAPLLVQL